MRNQIGDYFASGRLTTVFEHKHDQSLVILSGDYKTDFFKLCVFAVIGALEKIQPLANGEYYASVVKMDNDIDNPIAYTAYCAAWLFFEAHASPRDFVHDLHFNSSPLAQKILDLVALTVDSTGYGWFDNCAKNWLTWQNQAIPADVFQVNMGELSPNIRKFLQSIVNPFIQE